MARRSNAREAKIALRKAALAENLKPVHAGESGGQYKPLTESDVEQIDATDPTPARGSADRQPGMQRGPFQQA